MDDTLSAKLAEAGIASDAIGDPAVAWQRLHDRFGTRATLIDRYVLEAVARGVGVDDLSAEDKARLTLEVTKAHWANFEIVEGSDRNATDVIEVVDYDPSWPTRFAVWHDRLARALGDAAVRIDHVGSTAVPGLRAKPIIDIQISMADVEDEAAYVPAIEGLGVALRSRDAKHRYFRPAGDRKRDVQIHVCQVGSEWAREHLLFRDYLRTHADAAAAYAEMKLVAASRYADDRIAYNEFKTEFILDHLEKARAWAAATNWSSEQAA